MVLKLKNRGSSSVESFHNAHNDFGVFRDGYDGTEN
jgi:hypothetical protein